MELQIHRILHAGYVLNFQGTTILMDPIFENPFSRNCHAYPSIEFDLVQLKRQKFSAVLISHFHDDHCSLDSLSLINRETPIYIFCVHIEMSTLLKKLGFNFVHNFQLDQAIDIGAFRVTPRRAQEADVDSMLQIQVNGLNLLNVVDASIDSETLELLTREPTWDLILWPFQIMRETDVLGPRRANNPNFDSQLVGAIPEWAEQIATLNPRLLISSSCQFRMEDWSWYNHFYFAVSYARFQQLVSGYLAKVMCGGQPTTQIQRMNPGTGLYFSKKTFSLAENLSWIRAIGDQNLDYENDTTRAVPTTQAISRRFPSLNLDQFNELEKYLKKGIFERYAQIGEPDGLYFNQKIFWDLIVYDQAGDKFVYQYELSGSQMKLTTNMFDVVNWQTEIPISKLHAALTEGEALNSLYIRVNDREYSESIERKLVYGDVMDDPLIRCLFNDKFASFQECQLKRILDRAAIP